MNAAVHSSKTHTWSTPQEFFDRLNEEFQFTLDPCAEPETAKCEKFYTYRENGLAQDWTGERVFCNPPYGPDLTRWIIKCATEKTEVCVMLIPARTDTKVWHEWIFNNAEVRFVKGRLKFGGAENSAPFPSAVVIFRNEKGLSCQRSRQHPRPREIDFLTKE